MKYKLDYIIAACASKWQLSNIKPLVNMPLVNNYAAVAYSAIYKDDVVLKILFADTHEIEALKFFNDGGHNCCVKLLDYDKNLNGLLLEYVSPGISLKSMFPKEDSKAAEIAAEIIKKLHAKPLSNRPEKFKTVNQWLNLLSAHKSNKIPVRLLQQAIKLSNELLNSQNKEAPLYLLHGDLHHENILLGERGWIAIDPKGVIGPLEYELGRFIMNPIPDLLQQADATKIIENRIDKFCAIFGLERQRLIDWTFVQAVLSACWAEQGGSEEFFNYFVKFAEKLK